jgi:hypothetical protein
MENINNIAQANLEKAREIISELKIHEIWQSLDSTCNVVGSVKNGLLMNHLDIDFHCYSDDFSIEKSFTALGQISRNPKIKEVTYRNLLDAEDMCLEWHLKYEETPKRIWTIDMMHILNESPYAGVIERVTEKIGAALTDKLRQTILQLKWECVRQNEAYRGIDIYQAVVGEGIETFEDFKKWNSSRAKDDISLWEP